LRFSDISQHVFTIVIPSQRNPFNQEFYQLNQKLDYLKQTASIIIKQYADTTLQQGK